MFSYVFIKSICNEPKTFINEKDTLITYLFQNSLVVILVCKF